jgi:hypothetical protein
MQIPDSRHLHCLAGNPGLNFSTPAKIPDCRRGYKIIYKSKKLLLIINIMPF